MDKSFLFDYIYMDIYIYIYIYMAWAYSYIHQMFHFRVWLQYETSKSTQENAAGDISAITEGMVMDNDMFWDTVANIWVCLKMGIPQRWHFFWGKTSFSDMEFWDCKFWDNRENDCGLISLIPAKRPLLLDCQGSTRIINYGIPLWSLELAPMSHCSARWKIWKHKFLSDVEIECVAT